MTIRLSIINFAGMVRTLVAVGTERLASMLAARAFGMPFSAVTVFWSVVSDGREVPGAWAGIGVAVGAVDVVREVGWSAVIGPVALGSAAVVAAGAETSGVAATADGPPVRRAA